MARGVCLSHVAHTSHHDRIPHRVLSSFLGWIELHVSTHMGFHVSGWKSDMLRHSRVLGLNRPLGVSIRMEGGFRGYSGGNLSFPW